jgi:hypothetical protein
MMGSSFETILISLDQGFMAHNKNEFDTARYGGKFVI